jgi:hypothetical protein
MRVTPIGDAGNHRRAGAHSRGALARCVVLVLDATRFELLRYG